MILHDFTYPLGHIVTAKYWQKVEDGGLHLTVSDSGWQSLAGAKYTDSGFAVRSSWRTILRNLSPSKMLDTINRLKLTTFCAPPTIYRFLIKEDMSKCDFSTIKHAGIAGEPLNPEVYNRFLEATGLSVTEGFGQSETSVLIANFGWDQSSRVLPAKPSPLYDVDIVDEDGNSCEDGIVGSIVVKNTDKSIRRDCSKNITRTREATDRCWKNGVYNTGDTAWRDAEGYFWFVGRNDDVIKCLRLLHWAV